LSVDAVVPSEPTGPEASGRSSDGLAPPPAPPPDPGLLEQEGEVAADYLEGLLDIADLDGDLDMDVEGDRAMVSILGSGLDRLIGSNGETLDALQELTRLAVHQSTTVRSRLMLDVGGHRSRRRAQLTELGRRTAETVATSGVRAALDPMTPFERKVVHDAVAAVPGVRSESEGVEPERFVVVLPG
jgi:spoIIIJ-associated protein